MQLYQYGNLTPKNVVCCGPCDDAEHLQQGCLKKKNKTPEIPKRFHLLAALVISELA